ncbi:DUF1643 domain-containing protein [Moraxella sp. ZJ142]|uniref:DUF1643 domain-containing protein n=1 Tax=Moraxella marmotae TaxID=3344520 RepID=UPI0035D3EC96
MDYQIDIYKTDELNHHRFALGSVSKKTLFVFGINPSTADDKQPDPTIKKVMGFAEQNGYDSFVMFNLYPQRATNPNDLSDESDKDIVSKNIAIVEEIITSQKQADILLAWGGLFYARKYLQECMQQIYETLSASQTQIKWLRIGDMLKCGQPRHPLYAGYGLQLQEMNMADYVR